MSPHPIGAFLSLSPPAPVLEFRWVHEATEFNSQHRETTFFVVGKTATWVYVRYPQGLTRVYTSRNGSFAFEFNHDSEARKLKTMIGNVGEYYHNHVCDMHRVYIPKPR